MPATQRVLIAGAGLAGTALACGLRTTGAEIHLIERRPGPDSSSAGLLLTGNGVVALGKLGVAGRLDGIGLPVPTVRFCDARDHELFVAQLPAAWPRFLSLKRSMLQHILLESLRPLTPQWSTTVVALDPNPHGARVTFSSGECREYDLVVGADGVHSPLRQLVFGTTPSAPLPGYYGWRCIVERQVPGLDVPRYMLGNGRTLLFHPLRDGLVYCGAGPIRGQPPTNADDHPHQALRQAFAEFEGTADEVLSAVDAHTPILPSRFWHIRDVPWRRGRCLFIGDAAHACAPTLAQGGALAFEDAWVLCESLRAAPDVDTALAWYVDRRAPRVARAQDRSRQRLDAVRSLDPKAVALRNTLLMSVGASELLSAWAPLMEQPP